ncbi:hypothetical protein [Sphingobacterium paludis]|uniref:Uncharacterized protein n=1 Tax=Sphingobacterium paludis TaxID=1476465 RepID=A0A4R7DCV0_9SPHI|nr:hypothetical protein [Sphingobacterium paludis]TDS17764.1 hypothetical protein B0I21_101638 [Sphingobacterium paludis]
MEVKLTIDQLRRLVEYSAKLGAKIILSKSGEVKPYLKKSEAFKKYGRKNVEHWIEEGLITPRKDGEFSAAWRIELLEIESVKCSMELSNLFSK